MNSLKKRKMVFSILLGLVLFGHVVCSRQVQTIRQHSSLENVRAEALMVNPDLLRIGSGEFKGLWADYLLLKASIYIGGGWRITEEDWQALACLFEQSLVLDPYFFQTGHYIQAALVWRKVTQVQAIELVRYHAEHRNWDWEPLFNTGFDYYYFLKNNEKAAQYMLQAAKLQDAPPIVAILGARIAQRSSQTLISIAMLNMLYERTDNEKMKSMIDLHIQAYRSILAIEQALAEYQKRYGNLPGSLDNLVKTKILDPLPINPLGRIYFYDPVTGRVGYDEIR